MLVGGGTNNDDDALWRGILCNLSKLNYMYNTFKITVKESKPERTAERQLKRKYRATKLDASNTSVGDGWRSPCVDFGVERARESSDSPFYPTLSLTHCQPLSSGARKCVSWCFLILDGLWGLLEQVPLTPRFALYACVCSLVARLCSAHFIGWPPKCLSTNHGRVWATTAFVSSCLEVTSLFASLFHIHFISGG